jgi:Transglutaminase-like superfamily
MTKTLVLALALLPLLSVGQDFTRMAKEAQQKYKDAEAFIIRSGSDFIFTKDDETGAKITINQNKSLLSLRYNESVSEVEVYDRHSRIEKFSAESNLKQKAPDGARLCGTYTSEGLFYDDSKFCTHQFKLKEIGEVWDVHSIKKLDDAKYLTTVFFQEKYPLAEKRIRFVIPSEIEVEIREFNFSGVSITRSERIEGNNKVIEYVAKDLSHLKSETYERGIQYNHPHVLVLTKSVIVAGQKIGLITSVKDLYTWYSSLIRQLKPKADIFQSIVTQVTKDKKTDEEKIKAIYYWVQDNIRYIAFEDGVAAFKPDEAQDVFEKKYGDCKGMANLTREMLRIAGFDARLTWIGTRRIMYDQTVPSIAIYNHMICTVILNGKKYFLDATEKYMPFGENAVRIQDRPVMIEDGNQFILDKVTPSGKDRDAEIRDIAVALNGETLEGKYSITLKGEAKKNFLYAYHYTPTDKKKEFMENFISNGNDKIKSAEVQLPDLEERSGNLDLVSKTVFTSAVSSFNKEHYIDMDPFKTFRDWEIKPTRQGDIDFGEKVHRKLSITLTLPKGYSVAHLPENTMITNPGFSFSIQYKVVGDKVVYTKEINIPEGIIPKKSFESWNAAVSQLKRAYENQLVLKN